MPHLPAMNWDSQDRLLSTTRQAVNAGTPELTYYSYDAGGQRIRKVTERQAAAGEVPRRKAERIYLGGIEIYREYAADGVTITLERESLDVLIDQRRLAMVETRTVGNDPAPAQLVRHQFGNHLGSASLELDSQAAVISYEEYFPYGATSYQAVGLQNATPKRYRFTGKERDEESDLEIHGARYYAPWLGRWTSCDPTGHADGPNVYAFSHDSPIVFSDPSGTQGENSIDDLLTFIHAQAGFVTGQARPPTFNWRSASPFGTAAHKEAGEVIKELQELGAAGAERIYADVRVINGVVDKIGVPPGGPKGSHNIDILVTKPGETLNLGDNIGGGVAERIGDLKYGGGVINPKYGVHGSPLQTITGRTQASATVVEDAAAAVQAVKKTDQVAETVAKVNQTAEAVTTLAKVEEAAAGTLKLVGKAGKVEQGIAALGKVAKVAAPVAKVLKPLAPVAKVGGKVLGAASVAISAVELVTAKNTDQRIDAGIGLVGNTLMMSKNPVAMAAGGGLLVGQALEHNLNVSSFSADHGIATKEYLERKGVNDTVALVAGGVVTVVSTPVALGEAIGAKIKSWW
jgi:RHS repeat-associated protein